MKKENIINLRINFLKQMDTFINTNCDDASFHVWQSVIFSNCITEIFATIAQDDERWKNICKIFGRITEE